MNSENRSLYPFIGREIKNIRRFNHITQEELSNISGVNKDTIRKIENGYVDANIVTLMLLLESLGVSINDVGNSLFSKKGTMHYHINNIYKEIENSLLTYDYKKIALLLNNLSSLDYSFLPCSTYKEIESRNLLYKSFVENSLYGNYYKSLDLLFESIEISSNSFSLDIMKNKNYNDLQMRILMNIASIYNRMDIEKSLKIYDSLIYSGSDYEQKNELMYNSINSRYLVGDYNRAIKLNENLLKSIGNSDIRLYCLTLFQKGLLLEKLGNIDYALIFFKSAVQLSLISSNYKLYNKMDTIVSNLM